jgi:hypothetical protein
MIMIDTTPIPLPSAATLKKYGLTQQEWIEIYIGQSGQCGVCHKDFQPGKRINVDHAHVRGWKQMAPESRKKYIRGLLCYTCNRFLTMRGVTSLKLIQGYNYMRSFEVRITPESLAKDVRNGRSEKPSRTSNNQTHNQP